MKKIIALIACFALVLSLTGCMGGAGSSTDDVARASVVVKNVETPLAVTPETTEAAVDANGEPVDNNVYNEVAVGDTLTITGTGTIKAVTYRVNGGDIVVEKTAKAQLTVTEELEKLEAYVTDGNGIVSQWATYYFA